jgi:pimeloyl-ACP methyl ester carboxylesterase
VSNRFRLKSLPYDPDNDFTPIANIVDSAPFYGATRFLSNDTLRNGQPSAIAVDTIALMDALKIEKAILAGFDWGARTVNIVSALWPERCKATVSVSGYLIGSQEVGKMPLPPKAELEWCLLSRPHASGRYLRERISQAVVEPQRPTQSTRQSGYRVSGHLHRRTCDRARQPLPGAASGQPCRLSR